MMMSAYAGETEPDVSAELSGSGIEVRIFQVGEVPVFIFHVSMESLLDMEETPNHKIAFRQIRGGFRVLRRGMGFLRIWGGTLVSYRAKMAFEPYVPLLLTRSILNEDVKEKFMAISRVAVSEKQAFECKG